MNAEQHHTAADLWTKPTALSHRPACRLLGNHIHHRDLLLISTEADTHFTVSQRVEGWVNVDGWLHSQTVYLPTSSHPSKAQRRLTTLIKANALTTALRWLQVLWQISI